MESLFARYEADESELFDILEKEYSKLVKNNPNNVDYSRYYGLLYEIAGRRNLKKAEEIYKEVLFKHSENDYSDNSYNFRIDGQLMYVRKALGKNKDSIELYKKRILEFPEDAEEYLYLVIAYLNADQVKHAQKVMETVQNIIRLSKKNAGYNFRFDYLAGDIAARLGENEKALKYWEKSVIDEYTMDGYYSRAFLYNELGKFKKAAEEWRRIINVIEKYHDPSSLKWPKEELSKNESQLKQ